jgi:AcrR family transcriptional regulator
MSKIPYKEREKGRREHEILLNARRLIRESGYSALNMDDLADAVGISKPTLYQHFKSKEDLITHVLISAMQEMEACVCSSDEESPLERLKLALRVLLRHRYDNGLMADFDDEMVRSALYKQANVIAEKRRIMARVTQIVDEGKARGEITTTISTPMIGCLFFRLIGLPATMQTVMAPDTLLFSDPEMLTRLIDDVVELFVRSIVQDKAMA